MSAKKQFDPGVTYHCTTCGLWNFPERSKHHNPRGELCEAQWKEGRPPGLEGGFNLPRPAQPAKLKIANSQLPILNPEVLSADQAATVDRAKSYHVAFQVSAKQAAVYAFLSGRELNALKSQLPHGAWLPFRDAHLSDLSARTATRYMALADAISKNATVADLPTVGKLKLLDNGRLPEEQEKQVIAAFAEATDGKGLTELYRDTGIIREKKAQVFTPAKPLTAEEQIAAETEQLRAPHLGVAEHAQIILDRSELDNAKLGPEDWNDTLSIIVRLGKLARHFRRTLKARSAKAAKAAKVTSKAKAQWEKLKNKNPMKGSDHK